MARQLGKYELLDEIGHGGMATVYRALDERLDRHVAIKILHPHLQKAAEVRVRFAREAKSVAKLEHPNVLKVYDYSGEDAEESYIAVELLTGPTLKRFAEDHAEIPAEIAACFTLQIARALAAAHERGIIHRDVKPENVLLHEARLVKLTDFGIAQMVDSQSFTATGQILGSPGHMAPEQIEGGDIDARTDVFALGTVLYYLAVGRLPFTGRNPHQVLKRIVDGDVADPLRVRPSIGAPLREIILRALARDPAARYPSADDFAAALVVFLADAGIDDPDAELTAYLAEPEAHAERLHAQIIPRLVAKGRDAVARKDRATAIACFDRVLALDERHEEVLRLLDRLGRSDRRLLWTGLAAAAVAALVAGVVFWPTEGGRGDELGAQTLRAEDAGLDATALVLADAELDASELSAALDAGDLDAAAVTDAVPVVDAGAEPPDVRDPRRRDAGRRVVATGNGGDRRVDFQPSPQNVTISVNGAEPRAFGPAFRGVELAVGQVHRFRFESPSGCCEPLERELRLPPGDDPLPLVARLPFRPARLYVAATPADVHVLAGRAGEARGRTRSVIAVPMASAEETRELRVTAEGHEPYTTRVTLRAGELSNVSAALRPVL